jgi:S1-C subfamily serine protease
VFPGNSGGPVIDVRDGSAIGVAAVIVDSVGNYGLNAAIPSDYVKNRFPGIFELI